MQATVKVHAQTDNVAGVKLPKFEQLDSGSAAKMNLTGLGAGGQQVQVTRKVPLACHKVPAVFQYQTFLKIFLRLLATLPKMSFEENSEGVPSHLHADFVMS